MMENISWFWWVLMYLATCLFIGFPLALTACSVRNSWNNPIIDGWYEHLVRILCFPNTSVAESVVSMLRKDSHQSEYDDMPGFVAAIIENDSTYILVASILWFPKMVWTVGTSPPAFLMIGVFYSIIRVQRLWKKMTKKDSTAR